MNCPEEIKCFKCNHNMTKAKQYIGESSNIWPIGQIYHCDFCHESIGVTQDGRITHWTGKVIGVFGAVFIKYLALHTERPQAPRNLPLREVYKGTRSPKK